MKRFPIHTFHGVFPSLFILSSVLAIGICGAEMHDFKSAQGSVIRAELLKAKGQTIILRSDQGKELQVPLKSFSADDQLLILKWMVEVPAAIDHTFSVKVSEKDVPAGKKEDESESKSRQDSGKGRGGPGFMDSSSVRKIYDVNITSSTRASVYDLSVDWCAFMLDKVRGREDWRSMGRFGPSRRPGAEKDNENAKVETDDSSKGTLRAKRGSKLISKMDYSQSESFQTSAFTLDSTNSGSKSSDKLVGVWLRFYRGDTMVFEWKSPQCPKTEWPGGAHKSPPKLIASTSTEGPKKEGDTVAPPASESIFDKAPTPETPAKPAASEDEDLIVNIFELQGDKK